MRSNREKDLENIINEMYTHKIEVPADNTVGEQEHEAPEAGGSGLEALNTLAQKYGCNDITQCLTLMADVPGSNFVGELEDILGDPDEFKDAFELESTEEEATDTDEEPVDEGGCASHRKKKKTITAGHCK